MSNSQVNKLISVIKNATQVTLNFSSKVAGESNFQGKFQGFIKLLQMIHQLT